MLNGHVLVLRHCSFILLFVFPSCLLTLASVSLSSYFRHFSVGKLKIFDALFARFRLSLGNLSLSLSFKVQTFECKFVLYRAMVRISIFNVPFVYYRDKREHRE